MTTSLLRQRVWENQGLMTRGKQVIFQSNVFMTVYQNVVFKVCQIHENTQWYSGRFLYR